MLIHSVWQVSPWQLNGTLLTNSLSFILSAGLTLGVYNIHCAQVDDNTCHFTLSVCLSPSLLLSCVCSCPGDCRMHSPSLSPRSLINEINARVHQHPCHRHSLFRLIFFILSLSPFAWLSFWRVLLFYFSSSSYFFAKSLVLRRLNVLPVDSRLHILLLSLIAIFLCYVCKVSEDSSSCSEKQTLYRCRKITKKENLYTWRKKSKMTSQSNWSVHLLHIIFFPHLHTPAFITTWTI